MVRHGEHASLSTVDETLVDTTVRVATWNLWWRFGHWEQRWAPIVQTLRAADPDLIALQEVWEEGDRNQAAELAEALGDYHHVYAHRWEGAEVKFGNAVLSRWPIDGHEWRPLPAPADEDELRTVLRADVGGPRGPLSIFSTHLHYRLFHSDIRQEQVAAICEFARETATPDYPAVVAGDFNATPDADEIRMMTGRTSVPAPPVVFQDAWEAAADGEPGVTWSRRNPYAAESGEGDLRIDFVFTGWPPDRGRGSAVTAALLGDQPVGGVWPSDHFGVVVDLRY
jgi:endonuclease/exonuclease/phosphatase family metal-dependent hydrolase